jgi:hypothetical protein
MKNFRSMNQESRNEGKVERLVITGPSHRLGDKPIHLRVLLIRLYG